MNSLEEDKNQIKNMLNNLPRPKIRDIKGTARSLKKVAKKIWEQTLEEGSDLDQNQDDFLSIECCLNKATLNKIFLLEKEK